MGLFLLSAATWKFPKNGPIPWDTVHEQKGGARGRHPAVGPPGFQKELHRPRGRAGRLGLGGQVSARKRRASLPKPQDSPSPTIAESRPGQGRGWPRPGPTVWPKELHKAGAGGRPERLRHSAQPLRPWRPGRAVGPGRVRFAVKLWCLARLARMPRLGL